MQKELCTLLSNRQLFQIEGEDAELFLQNLLTIDVKSLKETLIYPAALLSPQGKILFTFLIARQEKRFLLDIAQNIASSFLQKITLYKLRAKVNIQLLDPHDVFIFKEEDHTSMIPNFLTKVQFSFQDIRLSPQLKVMRCYQNKSSAASPEKHLFSKEFWQDLRFDYGLIDVGEDFMENTYFPYDINYDCLGGLSFQKGCYIGQEVISRMYHRSAVKKRLFLLNFLEENCNPHALTIEEKRQQNITSNNKSLGIITAVRGNKVLAILNLRHLKQALTEETPIMFDLYPVSVMDCTQMHFLQKL